MTQHHLLIEASHSSKPLTLQQSRIVLTAISTLQPSDDVFETQKMRVKDLLDLFNITEKNYYLIEDACDSLLEKHIEIRDGDGWTKFPWFQKIKYHKNEGIVEFQFPNDLKPYLLQLKKEEGFTSYRLQNILLLRSPYAQRLYEICYKWRKAGGYEYELKYLKNLLGATKNSYDTYGSFKQRVLKPSIEDLKKTDIDVSFEEIKKGRQVVAIRFIVKSKEKEKKDVDDEGVNEDVNEKETKDENLNEE